MQRGHPEQREQRVQSQGAVTKDGTFGEARIHWVMSPCLSQSETAVCWWLLPKVRHRALS